MKRFSTFLFATLSMVTLLASCANQRVQVAYQGPETNTALVTSSGTVLIKYVDNDEVHEGFIGQEITYRVDAGQRVLLLEYSDLFNVSADEHEKVVSRPAKVTFQAEAGKTYKVVNPKQSNLEAAKTFAEAPEFSVVDAKTGANVEATQELSRPRTFLTELKSAVTPVYEFESDQVPVAQVEAAASSLEQLKSVWSRATEEEREAFRSWLSTGQ
ncbi:MAG: DUF2057 family protein [Pseudomonadota bacterium]|nr:DUF2057 family protein [Pseudomonadota bacterium]